jgi:hypothetical protein
MRLICLALLVAVGMVAVALAPLNVPAAEPPVVERVATLIEQLGSEQFQERERATQALDAIGGPALPALRQAAKSKDLEVSRRAKRLIVRIERRLETARVLQPKRVRLVYKETPLLEAVADFGKRTGHTMQLEGDQAKWKDRKITLDTGDVPFWDAFEQFCKKAGLVERGTGPAQVDDMPMYRTGRGGRVQVVRSWRDVGRPAAQPTILAEGKQERVPSCRAGALRIRALPAKVEGKGDPKRGGERRFDLELACDPRINWQELISMKITKAIDDQGQSLLQPVVYQPDDGASLDDMDQVIIIDATTGRAKGRYAPAPTLAPVRLKPAAKPSKMLKEVHGTIAARVEAPAEPLMTVDNILKAAGKRVEGPDGGFLKVLDVTLGDDAYAIRLQLQAPGGQLLMGGPPFARRGRVVVVRDSSGAGGDGTVFSIIDAKGKPMPLERIQGQAGRRLVGPREYTLFFTPGRGQPKPAKLVYSGRRSVVIEVPFTLKDVPLP